MLDVSMAALFAWCIALLLVESVRKDGTHEEDSVALDESAEWNEVGHDAPEVEVPIASSGRHVHRRLNRDR